MPVGSPVAAYGPTLLVGEYHPGSDCVQVMAAVTELDAAERIQELGYTSVPLLGVRGACEPFESF